MTDLSAGDYVTVTNVYSGVVTGTDDYGFTLDSGAFFTHESGPSLRAGKFTRDITVVKARPKVGEIVTATQLEETQWKRGTAILPLGGCEPGLNAYILAGDGEWMTWDSEGIAFGYITDECGPFILLHDAGRTVQ